MEINNPEEPSKEKPVLVADGRLSEDKLRLLLTYGQEEERLDYKETLDCAEVRRKALVDLVCDLVSMANTHGGYIVVGVRQEKNRQFTPVGVSNEVLGLYTDENIMAWLLNYADGQPEIRVKSSEIGGRDYLFVFVKKSLVPLVFKRDGAYDDGKGDAKVKFHSGDMFVRHGTRSERVTHIDVTRLLLEVREDERQKTLEPRGRHLEVLERLDLIAELLGGKSVPGECLDLVGSDSERVENRAARQVSSGRQKYLTWLLMKEASALKGELKRILEEDNADSLAEVLDRTFVGFLRGVIPVWRVAVDLDELSVAESISGILIEIFEYSSSLLDPVLPSGIDGLWLSSRVVFLACCLGAYCVYRDKPAFARPLLEMAVRSEGELEGYSWFRATTISLSRVGRSEHKTICRDVFEFFQTDAYTISMFGTEDTFVMSLCQFDFLQCVYAMVAGNANCFPSFGAYKKKYIYPIAEKIVRSRDDGVWVPPVEGAALASALRELDHRADGQFFKSWWSGWDSPCLREFLDEHPSGK